MVDRDHHAVALNGKEEERTLEPKGGAVNQNHLILTNEENYVASSWTSHLAGDELFSTKYIYIFIFELYNRNLKTDAENWASLVVLAL